MNFFHHLDLYVAHFTDCIQQPYGGQILDLSDERSTVLYESVLDILSG
jgi:hypothetical protein